MAKEKPSLNGTAMLAEIRRRAEIGQAPSDESFEQRYPALFSLLTNGQIDPTHVADGNFIRLSNNNGDWLLTVGVPALGMFGEVQDRTFDLVLTKLETALAANKIDWKANLKRPAKPRLLKEPGK